VSAGRVFECDPFAPGSQGSPCAALGTFNHEAAAVDPVHERIYLTEDQSDGRLYRATPSSYPGLGAGVLEAARILDPLGQGPIQPGQLRPLAWQAVAQPNPANGGVQNPNHLPLEQRATRYQVPGATAFAGGEGCWYDAGRVYFSTKGDDRIWALDTAHGTIEILYDAATTSDPELEGVDNVYASPLGDVYVAEDGGQMRIVALTLFGDVKPIVQLTGVSGSELTGPALSPDGGRLYFSSQNNPGRTYEVTGPFAPAAPVPLLGSAGRLLFAAALGLASAVALRERRPAGGGTGGSTSTASNRVDYPGAVEEEP
jgi:secreted PhoX family phosphatase